MSDFAAIDEEEVRRLTPIANLFARQLASHGLDPGSAQPEEWLSRLDLTLLYPEFGIPNPHALVGTDCPRVNPIELLRFFSKVIIRLDPCASEQEFSRVFFMKPHQLARLASQGQFALLRTSRAIHYPQFYRPLLQSKHTPQNDRLLVIVSLLRSGGDTAKSPLHQMEDRINEIAQGRWRGEDLRASFSGNVKRLAVFGYDSIAEALLGLQNFATATALAFHLNNLLCRRFTDAVGHFTCESGARLTDLRERMRSHSLPIDLSTGHPDFTLKEIGKGEPAPTVLKPGATWFGPTYRVELVGKDLWDLLNALILPLRTGIHVRSAQVVGSPERVAEAILSYKDRETVGRFLWEARSLAREGDFEAAELAIAEVARLERNFDASSRLGDRPLRHIVRYCSLGLRKAISYIPLIGGLMDDLVELGATVMRQERPDVLQTMSDRLASTVERLLPPISVTEESVFPMLAWGNHADPHSKPP